MPDSENYLKCACQVCGGHIEFPQSGVGAGIVCPHCGGSTVLAVAPLAPARRKPALAWVSILICAAGVGGVAWLKLAHKRALPPSQENAGPKETAPIVATPPPAAPAPDPWHGLKAGTVTLQKAENGNLVYAIGVLRNESNRERFGLKVVLDVFDAQDEKIGSATDYTPSILAGKEWRFKALVIDRKGARAAVANVTEQE